MTIFRGKSTCCKHRLLKRRKIVRASISSWCSRRLEPQETIASLSKKWRKTSKTEAWVPKTIRAEMWLGRFLPSLTPVWLLIATQTCKALIRHQAIPSRARTTSIPKITTTTIKIPMDMSHRIIRLPNNRHTQETTQCNSNRCNLNSNICSHSTCLIRIWTWLLSPCTIKISTRLSFPQFQASSCLRSPPRSQFNSTKLSGKCMETNSPPQTPQPLPFKT